MEKRLKWVDIYKGLAILLVVVGHSTGLFNLYIYQFHMAAFFFISGYTSKLEKKGILQTTVGKIYSLYFPYCIIFLISLGLVWLLHLTGGYSNLFKDQFPGFLLSVSEFFNHRIIYINLLGATWFLITLLGIYVLQKIILFFCFDRPGFFYFVISLFFFFLGYGIIKSPPPIPDNLFYLIYIGQFYFFLGVIFSQKKWLEQFTNRTLTFAPPLFVLNFIFFFVFAYLLPNTVDYPSRHFGNPFTNALAALNGILFLFGVSLVLDKCKWKHLSNLLVKTGQNTLGVIFLHFLFFKVSYCLLAIAGVVDWTYISTFVPTPEIGKQYWWLISSISLSLSVVTWSILLKNPFARVVFGQNKKILEGFLGNKGRVFINIDLFIIEQRNLLGHSIACTFKKLYGENRYVFFSLVWLILLVVLPWLMQGIINNDELQSRYWAQLGMGQFSNHYMGLWVRQGRILGSLLNIISMYLGFISTNIILFRGLSILLLLTVLGLFGWLIARLMKNYPLGLSVFVASVLLLPISFEPALPNAFVAFFSFPLILALVSFHLFLSYLEQGKKWMLLTSVLLWFFFLTGYEAFVMLTPVFVIIAFVSLRSQSNGLSGILLKCGYHLVASILFLISYFLVSKLFPSHYSGNSFAELDFRSSSAIIKQLVMSGIPGYFLFNSKYQHLFNIYSDSFQNMGTVLEVNPFATILGTIFPLKDTFLINLRNMFSELRVFSLIGISLGLAWVLGRREKGDTQGIATKSLPFLLGVPIGMAFLLTIPNSLAKSYQGIVNADRVVALPVTFLVYGFLIFSMVILLWFFWERMSRVYSALMLMGVIIVMVFPVQAMNGVFAQEQNRNFKRLKMIESAFDTNLLKHPDSKSIFAPDIYLTKNALAIHEGYWSSYSKGKGLSLDISSKFSGQPLTLKVLSNKQLALLSAERVVLLSMEKINNRKFLFYDPLTNYSSITYLSNGVNDGIFYKYSIEIEKFSYTKGGNDLLFFLSQ